jgi:hypothetical protein
MTSYETEQARLTVRRQRDGTYDVFDGAGVRVSEGHGERLLAERALDKIARRNSRTVRECLTCDDTFLSEGPHNRMCNCCRRRARDGAWLASASVTGTRPSGGVS